LVSGPARAGVWVGAAAAEEEEEEGKKFEIEMVFVGLK
jgi:hypothetical protein